MQPIQNFLLEIKYFLTKNNKLDGVQYLLHKLNCYLQMLTSTPNPIVDDSQKQVEELQEIIFDSEQEQINLEECIVSPRKFANFLDIFILDYNFESQVYDILPFFAVKTNSQLNNDRKAILQLIIAKSKQHCVQKQRTNSMTQLHRLTSNISKNAPALILPNYSSQEVKYIYIYETKECVENKKKYYLVDRYFCFVTDGLVTSSIDSLFKTIKSRIFQERILKIDDPLKVYWKYVKDKLLAAIPLLVDQANQITLKLQDPSHHVWVQNEHSYSIKQLQASVAAPLLVILTYLAICQFKIVLIISKDLKHMLSDLMISIQGAMRPLKYVFPVVFCTLTKMHVDFVQSPVPLTIGYWGSQKKRQKFTKQFQIYMQQNNSSHTIGIDLEKNIIISQTGMTSEDIFIIQKINSYIKKEERGQFLWQKISNFLKQTLEDMKSNKKKSEWKKLLEQKIQQSQIYEIYCNK